MNYILSFFKLSSGIRVGQFPANQGRFLIVHLKVVNLTCLFALLSVAGCSSEKGGYTISNDHTTVQVFNLKDNQLAYSIHKDGHSIIDTSSLGIVLENRTLGTSSTITKTTKSNIDIRYDLLGVKSEATYQGELTKIEIEEEDGFKWVVEFQLSEEGVAYRYKVPNEGKSEVLGELTSFRFPDNTKVWYFERNNDWKLKSHAGEWLSADISKMPTVSIMGPVQGMTITCEMPNGTYAMLAEAALFNYSGMRLEAIGDNSFQANFTEGEEGFEIAGDITSPWRCILLADDLNVLVNNTMVPSLNPAPDQELFADRSWIKPGKSAWHWWSGKYVFYNEEIEMVDDAQSLNLEYNMVDEGWEKWDDKWTKLTALCDYAREKGIGIFVWKRSKEINFPDNNYEIMTNFLDSVQRTGAIGVKVDFMNGQSKALIEFDEMVLRKAAERKLMVNFHGCQQSSGEYRTYPNEVTREGIRGLEVNHMKEGPLPAAHNAALPFTRFVTGHADYTPIGFTDPGETTWAHQLATLVCFYSPFQCIAENTQFLLSRKEIKPALDFIMKVPPVWDETIVLPESKIGDLAVMARRKGKDWYVGVLSGTKEKTLIIDCSFLQDYIYEASIFSDDRLAKPINLKGINQEANLREHATAIPFKKQELNCDSDTKIELDIAANGGAVIWFKTI